MPECCRRLRLTSRAWKMCVKPHSTQPHPHLCPSVETWNYGRVHIHSGVHSVCITSKSIFTFLCPYPCPFPHLSHVSHASHGWTASGGWMGCCFHRPGLWSGAKGSPGSGEGIGINN